MMVMIMMVMNMHQCAVCRANIFYAETSVRIYQSSAGSTQEISQVRCASPRK